MIAREDHDVLPPADPGVEEREEVRQERVHPHHHVRNLEAVRPVCVSGVVGSREAHTQQIRHSPSPEGLPRAPPPFASSARISLPYGLVSSAVKNDLVIRDVSVPRDGMRERASQPFASVLPRDVVWEHRRETGRGGGEFPGLPNVPREPAGTVEPLHPGGECRTVVGRGDENGIPKPEGKVRELPPIRTAARSL